MEILFAVLGALAVYIALGLFCRRSFGLGDVEVRAQVAASLNGREQQMLIEPEVDVSEVERQGLLGHADWVVPLRTPLN